MLFTFFGQFSIPDCETNSHADTNDLHGSHRHIYNPGTPVFDRDSNDHIDPKDPRVLSNVYQC